MLQLTKTVYVRASINRVWATLLNFSRYAEWHPFLELSGIAAEGEHLELSFRQSSDAVRRFRSQAEVIRLEPKKMFAIRFGVRGLLLAEHSFELTPANEQTSVTHTTTYRGIVPLVTGSISRNRLLPFVEMPARSLELHLSGARTAAHVGKGIRRQAGNRASRAQKHRKR